MIIKKQSAAATLIELMDDHHTIIRLLDQQQRAARALYEDQKKSGQYSRGVLLHLEMMATASERLFMEQGWLLKSIKRADERVDEQDMQRISEEVAAEMEQEKAHQEQLLLDAWYMFDPS